MFQLIKNIKNKIRFHRRSVKCLNDIFDLVLQEVINSMFTQGKQSRPHPAYINMQLTVQNKDHFASAPSCSSWEIQIT